MPQKPPTYRPPGARSPLQRERDYEAERREQQRWRAWYKLAVWTNPEYGLRAQQLARQPLCETCLRASPRRLTPATVVHHKEDHKGDWQLFIDQANHESACKPCHDSELQARARRRGGGVESRGEFR